MSPGSRLGIQKRYPVTTCHTPAIIFFWLCGCGHAFVVAVVLLCVVVVCLWSCVVIVCCDYVLRLRACICVFVFVVVFVNLCS